MFNSFFSGYEIWALNRKSISMFSNCFVEKNILWQIIFVTVPTKVHETVMRFAITYQIDKLLKTIFTCFRLKNCWKNIKTNASVIYVLHDSLKHKIPSSIPLIKHVNEFSIVFSIYRLMICIYVILFYN